MTPVRIVGLIAVVLWAAAASAGGATAYVIVDTGQATCYSDTGAVINPQPGEAFYGQDAQFDGPAPSYRDNGDGTVSDLNTGLMWQQDPGDKVVWEQAVAGAEGFDLAGHTDWRLPSIKELYSLMDFRGVTGRSASTSTPFLDTDYFVFRYGDVTGERFIDSQYCSNTEYVSTTMNGNHTVFGVNFADGRIKGYGTRTPRGAKTFYCMYVRGNPEYGSNDFVDNGDGTITDLATGLMWQQGDDGVARNWEEALACAENLTLAGASDWRLPNAKELQSIVDYTRSPDATGSAAIDPVFDCTAIAAEDGSADFGFYWTGTSHLDGPRAGMAACYVAFGRAWGNMRGAWMDVHGAGCQRSDPKSGDPSQFPSGRGPQGDAIRIYNMVRCVRDLPAKLTTPIVE